VAERSELRSYILRDAFYSMRSRDHNGVILGMKSFTYTFNANSICRNLIASLTIYFQRPRKAVGASKLSGHLIAQFQVVEGTRSDRLYRFIDPFVILTSWGFIARFADRHSVPFVAIREMTTLIRHVVVTVGVDQRCSGSSQTQQKDSITPDRNTMI
jgi:hypothetical protein